MASTPEQAPTAPTPEEEAQYWEIFRRHLGYPY